MKIKKGDEVKVIAGKDKGKTGKVLQALHDTDKVIVEGVFVVKRHTKNKVTGTHGEIIEKTMPIHVSNVMILDPKDKVPTRIGYSIDDKGNKTRIAKKSGSVIK
jgi:large subunit ribosomal protein L24